MDYDKSNICDEVEILPRVQYTTSTADTHTIELGLMVTIYTAAVV